MADNEPSFRESRASLFAIRFGALLLGLGGIAIVVHSLGDVLLHRIGLDAEFLLWFGIASVVIGAGLLVGLVILGPKPQPAADLSPKSLPWPFWVLWPFGVLLLGYGLVCIARQEGLLFGRGGGFIELHGINAIAAGVAYTALGGLIAAVPFTRKWMSPRAGRVLVVVALVVLIGSLGFLVARVV